MTGTREFEELMQMFERMENCTPNDREARETQKRYKGAWYRNGERNERFKMFMAGYSYGKSTFRCNCQNDTPMVYANSL